MRALKKLTACGDNMNAIDLAGRFFRKEVLKSTVVDPFFLIRNAMGVPAAPTGQSIKNYEKPQI